MVIALMQLEPDQFEELFPGLHGSPDDPIPLDNEKEQPTRKNEAMASPYINMNDHPPACTDDIANAMQTIHNLVHTNPDTMDTSLVIKPLGTIRPAWLDGLVYAMLKPILPLPKAIKPIVTMLLMMETSGAPPMAIADACSIVKATMRAVQPGLSGQMICGMMFDGMGAKLGSSVNLHHFFLASTNSGLNDDPEVDRFFLNESDDFEPVQDEKPQFIPTNLQLAVAYGYYYANHAKTYGLERFVENASVDIIERMSVEDKKELWIASVHFCDRPSMANQSE
jgi:hypothetical protein